MAERHRGRDAGLARIDDAAVFGREPAQIEHLDLEVPARARKSRARSSRAARSSSFRPGQVCSLRLAPLISRMRGGEAGSFCRRSASLIVSLRLDPFDRELVVGIGDSPVRRGGCAAPCGSRVGLPGDLGDAIDLRARADRRPDRKTARAYRFLNSRFVELDLRHFLANGEVRHGVAALPGIRPALQSHGRWSLVPPAFSVGHLAELLEHFAGHLEGVIGGRHAAIDRLLQDDLLDVVGARSRLRSARRARAGGIPPICRARPWCRSPERAACGRRNAAASRPRTRRCG